jgi:hypothetical protein
MYVNKYLEIPINQIIISKCKVIVWPHKELNYPLEECIQILTHRNIEEFSIFYVQFVFWFAYVIDCETVGCCKISTEGAIIAITGD